MPKAHGCDLLRALLELFCGGCDCPKPKPTLEGEFMFVVKDNNPDVSYQLVYKVADAEGQPVPTPAGLMVEVLSDDPDVVQLTPDPVDQNKGMAHFGAPGLANVNATVKLADGTLVGSFGAQVTVTAGDPASISGGTLTFDGLTEV